MPSHHLASAARAELRAVTPGGRGYTLTNVPPRSTKRPSHLARHRRDSQAARAPVGRLDTVGVFVAKQEPHPPHPAPPRTPPSISICHHLRHNKHSSLGGSSPRQLKRQASSTSRASWQPAPDDDAPSASEEPHGDKLGLLPTLRTLLSVAQESRALREAWLVLQMVANIVCLLLYVMGTYGGTEAANATFRTMEVACSLAFALQYFITLMAAESKLRAMTKPAMVFDPLTWAPTILSTFFEGTFAAVLPDLRWMRVFRALRVIRVLLLSEPTISKHRSQETGVDWVLFQVVGSIVVLLFSCASVVQVIEQIPWHDALYFIVTTFTTVGFGDFVPTSFFSRMAVCAMMLIGVVLIPVRASQIYTQLQRRKDVLGPLPRTSRQPFVLVSGRISSLRGFRDFFDEFFHEIIASDLDPDTRMVCLSDVKPSFELRAFQELHEQRMTVVEGSGFNEEHLVRARAQASSAVLLLCDRLSPNGIAEDLRLLFQVWALKSYSKSVPLYVQALREETVSRIAPFLDVHKDVVLSVERIRYSTLALSCVCPGASTLLGNMLRRAEIQDKRFQDRSMAGRQWLREYANGCSWGVYQVDIEDTDLVGRRFLDATSCIFAKTGCTMIGLNVQDGVLLNPGGLLLRAGDKALLVARSIQDARKAITVKFEQVQVAVDAWESSMHSLEEGSFCDVSASPVHPLLQSESGSLEEPDGTQQQETDSYEESQHEGEGDGKSDVGESTAITTSYEGQEQAFPAEMLRDGILAEGSHDEFPGDADFPEPGYIPRPVANSDDVSEPVLEAKEADVWGQMGYEALVTFPLETGSSWPNEPLDPLSPASAAIGADGPAGFAAGRGRVLSVTREGSRLTAGIAGRIPKADGWSAAELGPLRKDASRHSSVMEVIEPFLQLPEQDNLSCEIGNGMSNHVILCGCHASMPGFLKELNRCTDDSPDPLQTVVVSTSKPNPAIWSRIKELSPGVTYHNGDPSDPMVLRAVNAGRCRSVIHLAITQSEAAQQSGAAGMASRAGDRVLPTGASTLGSGDDGTGSESLADAEALLLCYGVGEVQKCTSPCQETLDLVHTVVELCLTSSVKFLQPGLMLRGYAEETATDNDGLPRQSWLLRKAQEKAVKDEGMASWQANAYYASGRVSLPAIIDTFSCASFFNGGLMVDILVELTGEVDIPAGALLQQVDVPRHLRSSTYGELHAYLVGSLGMVPLGLYRRKARNWKLPYVATNPSPETRLRAGDRVFVLRERLAPNDGDNGSMLGAQPTIPAVSA